MSSGVVPTDPHPSYTEAPELHAALQVGSHKNGVEWGNHLPRPAFEAALDMAGYDKMLCSEVHGD